MTRRLDLGIASYGNPRALDVCLRALRDNSATDWRCLIVMNQHPDTDIEEQTFQVISRHVREEQRLSTVRPETNIGYAGAVNAILQWATTEYVAYLDNDATAVTSGWDEQLASVLDRFHELGVVFPNGGAAAIPRGPYQEILWAAGFCWMVTRMAMTDALSIPIGLAFPSRPQYMDESLGHQEEVDFQTRLRLAGYKIGAVPEVYVHHASTSTNNPASVERISRGVVNWVTKWNRYFCGRGQTYHSPNVLRHEDWHPTALHMEQFFKLHLGEINASPEEVSIAGVEYDLIKVPRLKGFYRNRII